MIYYSFSEADIDRETQLYRKIELSYPLAHCLHWSGLGQAKARVQGLNPNLAGGCQGPKYLSHHYCHLGTTWTGNWNWKQSWIQTWTL